MHVFANTDTQKVNTLSKFVVIFILGFDLFKKKGPLMWGDIQQIQL